MTIRRHFFTFVRLSSARFGWEDECQVDFENQITPFLARHCVRCHSPSHRDGDVSLATFYHNGIERRLTDVHGHVMKEILA